MASEMTERTVAATNRDIRQGSFFAPARLAFLHGGLGLLHGQGRHIECQPHSDGPAPQQRRGPVHQITLSGASVSIPVVDPS